jgi:hypothetical protein
MTSKALILATAALVGLAGPALEAKPRLTGEERLAKMLEGRVAGEPVSCINTFNTRDTTIIDKTAIVYHAGNVIYVNRPRYPSSLDDDRIMVTEIRGGQLCKLDTVRMHDRTGGFYAGFVGLEDFVPYRRVAAR